MQHTYWFKSCHLRVSIGKEILLCIIDRHSTIDAIGQRCVLHDRHTLIRSIRMFEEHDGGPVIGKVLGEGTCCAGALCADIACHIWFKGIPTDDLMKMARRGFARLDERVDALDAQSRTPESKGCLGRHGESKGERNPLHLCRNQRVETSEASSADSRLYIR